jgi:hypothetical protein
MATALIHRIHIAVKAGDIKQPITRQDVEKWMDRNNIRKPDGKKYKDGYAANLLSNSLYKKKQTKNRNSKWLYRHVNKDGTFEYWFVD